MKTIYGLVAALCVVLAAGDTVAQSDYPDKTVRILVGFPPGGPPDIAARVLAEKFSEAWGKPVVVENVTGGGGNIAIERAAKAAPDGYTLVMASNAIVINPSLYLVRNDVRGRFGDLGMDVIAGTPAEFSRVIQSETAQWAKLIKDAGIKPTE